MSKRKTTEQFIKDLNDSDVEVIGEYKTNKTKILVRYKSCGHEDSKTPSHLLRGQRCSECKYKRLSKAKMKTTKEYISDLRANGLEHIEVIGEYKGSANNIEVLNTNCNHAYEAIAGNILSGSGCPICHGMKDTQMFTDEINNKYPNEYDVLGEYVNNREPILVRHSCGYEWEVIPKDLLSSQRCPKCRFSKGELFIQKYLERNNVVHTPQYRFDDCRNILPLPFDFKIRVDGELRLIEFDGQQHYDSGVIFFSESIAVHDEIKNDYCSDNNIKLLRIPYWWLRNDRIEKELDTFCK